MNQTEINNLLPDATKRKSKEVKFPCSTNDYGDDDPETTEDLRNYGPLFLSAALIMATFAVIGIVNSVIYLIDVLRGLWW